jgi:hypothetical protein
VPLGPSLSSPTPLSTPRVYLWVNPKRLDEEVRDGKRKTRASRAKNKASEKKDPRNGPTVFFLKKTQSYKKRIHK